LFIKTSYYFDLIFKNFSHFYKVRFKEIGHHNRIRMKFLKSRWENVKLTGKNYLQSGLSAHKVSFSISAGLVLGIIPVPGTTIALCILAAIIFKLNHVLIQTINMIVYPLQLLLILPFYRMGNVFFMKNTISDKPFHFNDFSLANLWQFLGKSTGSALILWTIISIPIGLLIYSILLKALTLNKTKELS